MSTEDDDHASGMCRSMTRNCYWYAIFTSYSVPVDKTKDARPAAGALRTAGLHRRARTRPNDYGFESAGAGQGDLYRHGQRHQRPTTSGAVGIDGADPGPHQRTSRQPEPTRRSCCIAACLAAGRSKKVAGGEKPMLFLDEANAKSIQGPADPWTASAPTQGAGRCSGWKTDVKRRPRPRPWAAPVPKDIAGKVHHLTAAE